jgi:hypothetical protein
MTASLIGFLAAFALIFLRVPISVSLALTGFAGLVALSGWMPAMTTLVMSVKSSTMNYTLSVLPLFILMGNFVARAGLAHDFVRRVGDELDATVPDRRCRDAIAVSLAVRSVNNQVDRGYVFKHRQVINIGDLNAETKACKRGQARERWFRPGFRPLARANG